MTTVVLGPARSGKSARAVALARATGKSVIVAATAAVDESDAEMLHRVDMHRRARPTEWTVVETGLVGATPLVTVLRDAPSGACVIVDSLGTWISTQLLRWKPWCEETPIAALDDLEAQAHELAAALLASAADVILVAEETGWGLVPTTPLGRLFRDALGRAVQIVSADADRIELVVAGYAVDLRQVGRRIDEV
ncbi:MAG: bifunctional adenosylcobinamide kinase/adenosylcobinamide-phosphate guanylyltransferase [Candidatus Elarobacter sp.]